MSEERTRLQPSRAGELHVGEWVEVNGQMRRVLAMTLEPAADDDPEMGVVAGDMVATFVFSDTQAIILTPEY